MKSRYAEIEKQRFRGLAKHNIEACTNIVRHPFYSPPPHLSCDPKIPLNRFPALDYSLANSFYGLGGNLENASGYKGKVVGFIEHGLHLGGANPVTTSSPLPCIITLGERRRKAIRQTTNKPVFTVGPYIHYAKSYIDEEAARKIKKELGKTLLVFPSHGIEGVEALYDTNVFIGEVKSFVHNHSVDTVLVSLYFKDIPKYFSCYRNAGMRVVCAGHRSDPAFLSRQKSLIELSDFTLSNNVGTHIGYCCSLGKPHLIISQETHYHCSDASSKKSIPNHTSVEFELDRRTIQSAFSSLDSWGTKVQEKVLEEYWGFGEEKDAEQLRSFFEVSAKVFKRCRGNDQSFKDLYLRCVEESQDPQLNTLILECLR